MRLFTPAFLPVMLAGLLPALSQAQTPALLSTSPARHSLTGSRTAPVQLTFSRAVAAPAPIQVHTNQRHGRRAGTLSGAGTAQVSFQPTQPFAPGECVSVTVPASVSSPAQVVEFRAATGRGAATFGPAYTIGAPLNATPAAAAAGDLDHDGDLDLLVVNYSANTAQVCLNNGSGQFAAQSATVPINPRASTLRLVDFNGDGNLDALSTTIYTQGGGVSLNLGTGQGTFASRAQLSGFASTTGDFNADGFTDIVIGDIGGTNAVLRFLPGNASGALNPSNSSPTTISVQELGTADMDEDGDLDLLVNAGNMIGIYLNNGSGQFTAGTVRSVNQNYGGITIGDFNGDGHADIASPSFSTSDVTLLLGTGTGGLQAPQVVAALSRTRYVSSGDLDGDGDLDLIVTNDRGITQTLLNNGQGQFATPSAILIGFEAFNFADAADLNGDGSLDIYTGHSVSNPTMQHGLDVFFNQPPTITHTAAARLALDFVAAPNPAHEQIVLTLSPSAGPVTIELRDALGRLVRALPVQPVPPAGAVGVSLVGLAPGRYAVCARTAAGRGMQWVDVQ